MTKRETGLLALVLMLAAIVLHVGHYLIFRDFHQLSFYFLLDVAFLPVNVLVLTLLVDRLLNERERAGRRHKMNMVVGVFFTELGRPLLSLLRDLLPPEQASLAQLQITAQTTPRQIMRLAETAATLPLEIVLETRDLAALKALLDEHEELTLRLLANPALLEHEEFTDVLWAVVHLGEELSARQSFENLPAPDIAHLQGDTLRVYSRLLRQWLQYLAHLQQYYPYLYSFAVRADPLHPGGPVEVTE